MKPRVISTPWYVGRRWLVIEPVGDRPVRCYSTWQDAMDAAIQWFNEHHFLVQDRQGYWWFFNREHGLLNTGATKQDAMTHPAATRPTNHTQGETP